MSPIGRVTIGDFGGLVLTIRNGGALRLRLEDGRQILIRITMRRNKGQQIRICINGPKTVQIDREGGGLPPCETE